MKVHENAVRAGIAGLLGAFSFFLLKELLATPLFFVLAIVGIIGAVLLARSTAHHFHSGHTHAGDSVFDGVAVSILLIANILHPAVDGFSVFETFEQHGMISGWVLLGSVVLHECVRQAALITVFRDMGIRWYWVVITALAGIAGGVGMGFVGSHFLHEHEGLIDVVTVCAYAFIVAEFYSGHPHQRTKKGSLIVLFGIVVGTLLALFVKAH